MRRWLLWIGGGAVVLVVVLVIGAKLALRTGFAANRVAAQIQAAAGAPVQVGSLEVGVTGSSLHDLQFLEEREPRGAHAAPPRGLRSRPSTPTCRCTASSAANSPGALSPYTRRN